jgi:hypothetical protein
MSTPINDGGPAFPELPSYGTPTGTISINTKPGMSLRDYFAGQALAGYLALPEPGQAPPLTKWSHKIIAEGCYMMADAMLAVRAGTKPAN